MVFKKRNGLLMAQPIQVTLQPPLGGNSAVAPQLPASLGFDPSDEPYASLQAAVLSDESDDYKEAEPLLSTADDPDAHNARMRAHPKSDVPSRGESADREGTPGRKLKAKAAQQLPKPSPPSNTNVSLTRLLRESKSEWYRLGGGSVCLFAAAACNLVVPTLFGRILDAMTVSIDSAAAIRIAQVNCILLVCKYIC